MSHINSRYKTIKLTNHTEWVKGCPIKISKSQILFDTKKNQGILQVKMFNLENKQIKYVYLDIECYDDTMELVTVKKDMIYPVLDAKPQTSFGDRQPVILDSLEIANVKILIKKVTFTDESIWMNSNNDFGIELGVGNLIDRQDEVYEQLMRECEKESVSPKYIPDMNKKFWRCTCGQLNLNEKSKCGYCQCSKEWLKKHFDKKYLLAANAQYREAERQRKQKELEETLRREEEEKLRRQELRNTIKKNIPNILIVFLVVAIFIVSMYMFLN